jgi:hypothetical protein
MTMHLAHPSISLNGKRKGKQKFKNAAEAQRARELAESFIVIHYRLCLVV